MADLMPSDFASYRDKRLEEGAAAATVDRSMANFDVGGDTFEGTKVNVTGDGNEDITDYCGEAPDMGAYEYGGSSLSGDLNGDYLVNVLDVVAIINMILNLEEYNSLADINQDEILNVLDVVLLVNSILG